MKVVKAVKPEDDDECLYDVREEEDEDVEETVSKGEGEEVKKEGSNGRRFFGPFKCSDCGKILSSKVI